MQICMGDYDPAVRYLYTNEQPELGVVQRMETVKGKFVLFSGFFAKGF